MSSPGALQKSKSSPEAASKTARACKPRPSTTASAIPAYLQTKLADGATATQAKPGTPSLQLVAEEEQLDEQPVEPAATPSIQTQAAAPPPEEDKEDELPVAAAPSLQRQTSLPEEAEEDEPEIQASPLEGRVQSQPAPEEEDALTTTTAPAVQRQAEATPEEEQEVIRTKPQSGFVQRQEEVPEEEEALAATSTPSVQRQAEPVPEDKEEELRLIPESGLVQRQEAMPLEEEESPPPAGTVQAKLTVGSPDDEYERQADQVSEQVMRLPATVALTAEKKNAPGRGATRTKLRIGRPDDEFEREADQVADIVQRRAQSLPPEQEGPLLQPNSISLSSIQRLCSECADDIEPQEKQGASTVRTKAEGTPVPRVSADTQHSIESPGSGSPLLEHVRSSVEPVLGTDLGHVRVHADSGAHEMASDLNAKAFTHRDHIWLGPGQSSQDTALMAHEAAHVVQQTGLGLNKQVGAPREHGQAAEPPLLSRIQRALLIRGEEGALFIFMVPFKGEHLIYSMPLSASLLELFDADIALSDQIEAELADIFNPTDLPLHETAEFMGGSAVARMIDDGIRAIEEGGYPDFRALEHFLRRRTELFYEQTLLPELSAWLAPLLGVEEAAIEWPELVTDLQIMADEFEAETAFDASLYNRYRLFLGMVAMEAEQLDAAINPVPVDTAVVENELLSYVSSLGADAFAEGTLEYHSESFLEDYVSLIEQIRYVPDDFDIEAYRPEAEPADIVERRDAIITAFMDEEAGDLMVRFILDDWARSRQPPEEFLAQLDMEALRERIVSHLTDVVINDVRQDRELMHALRSRAGDEARFTQIRAIYSSARGFELRNAGLWGLFVATPIEELTAAETAVASDPYAYHHKSLEVAEATRTMLSALPSPGTFERDVFQGALQAVEALDIPAEFAGLFLLPELLGYLDAFKDLVEAQEEETRSTIAALLDLEFPRVARIIRNLVDHAEKFVRERWIPMLKIVAIEKVWQNLGELRHLDENWEVLNRDLVAQFVSGAAELMELAEGLESRRFESIEYEGQEVRRDGADHLRAAARTMLASAMENRDAENADERREKIRGAISDYEQVIADIESGEYDPLDYSSVVYEEARERLGIHLEFARATTVGMVLSRQVVAGSNPFLMWAITRWRYKTGLERTFWRATTLVALGLLTLAAALVPGALGVILVAVDIALGIYTGAQQVADARTTLRMARLDIHGDIVGVSEREAERALTHAWIGLGVSVIMTVGVGAFRLRATIRTRGGGRFSRGSRASPASRAQQRVLARSGRKPGERLSPKELSTEIDVASRSPRRPSREPGFVDEVHLENGHIWRRKHSGTWCRFSRPSLCGIRFETFDRIAHGGWYTRKAWRRRIHTGTWSRHGHRHLRARTEAQAQTMSTHGNSQYLPGIDNRALEQEALFRGTVTRGVRSDPSSTAHVYYRFDRVIGYSEGQPTRWIRAEITSGNVFHGHPRSLRLVRRSVPDATP